MALVRGKACSLPGNSQAILALPLPGPPTRSSIPLAIPDTLATTALNILKISLELRVITGNL
jgi:hypothetical protein